MDESNLAPRVPSKGPNPVDVLFARLNSDASRRAFRVQLCIVGGMLSGVPKTDPRDVPWERMRYAHLVQVMRLLRERGYSVATCNLTLHAVRGVLQECFNLGLIDADTLLRLRAVKPVYAEAPPAGRLVSPEELSLVLAELLRGGRPVGLRNAAMLAVLAGGGLRRSEMLGLSYSDYDAQTGGLKIRNGKGRKSRESWLAPSAMRYLVPWMEHRGDWDGPLFTGLVTSTGVPLRTPAESRGLNRALVRAQALAGVPPFTPHDMRRTFVSRMLDSGVDVSLVQGLVGHSNTSTTVRYDRRPTEARRAAVSRLWVGAPGDAPIRAPLDPMFATRAAEPEAVMAPEDLDDGAFCVDGVIVIPGR